MVAIGDLDAFQEGGGSRVTSDGWDFQEGDDGSRVTSGKRLRLLPDGRMFAAI